MCGGDGGRGGLGRLRLLRGYLGTKGRSEPSRRNQGPADPKPPRRTRPFRPGLLLSTRWMTQAHRGIHTCWAHTLDARPTARKQTCTHMNAHTFTQTHCPVCKCVHLFAHLPHLVHHRDCWCFPVISDGAVSPPGLDPSNPSCCSGQLQGTGSIPSFPESRGDARFSHQAPQLPTHT